MYIGILLAVATGATWTSFGILLSFTANEKRDVISFGILFNIIYAVIAFILLGKFSISLDQKFMLLSLAVLIGDVMNGLAQYVINRSMTSGNNAAVWAIVQGFMVLPFITAQVFFGHPSNLAQWLGVCLILCGILLPHLKKSPAGYRWLILAVTAFFLTGLSQSLYSIPSQLSLTDESPLLWSSLAGLGNVIAWMSVALVTKHRFSVRAAMPKIAFVMAMMGLLALTLFFIALDHLSKVNLGNVAIPLMVGSNVVFFTLYSKFKLREKTSWQTYATIIVLIIGLILLAFK